MRRSQTKAASEAKQAEGGDEEARMWQATVSSDKTKRGYGFVVGHFATEIEVPYARPAVTSATARLPPAGGPHTTILAEH